MPSASDSPTATRGDVTRVEKELLILSGKITLLQGMVGLVMAVEVLPLVNALLR